MQKSLRKRYIKLNAILALAAIILSIISYFAFLSNYKTYSLNQISQQPVDEYSYSYYMDLDHNGSFERYQFGKAVNSDVYFVQPFNDNGTLRDQFNFSLRVIPNSIQSFDLNKDNYDELFVFSKDDSVLALSIIDIKNSKFLAKEISLLSKPEKVTSDFWDVNDILSEFADLDGDNNYELYFSPLTGHSIYPRGLFVLDLELLKIVNSFETTAPISKIVFHDINNDKQDDIILRASSSGNTIDRIGIHDNANWLIFLDKQLNFIEKPYMIGEFLNGIYFDIVKSNNIEYILFLFNNKKDKAKKEFIALLDYNFNVQKKIELDDSKQIADYIKDENIFSDIFYITFKSGELESYDLNLNPINSIKLNDGNYLFTSVENIVEESGKEIILRTQNELLIFSEDLKFLAHQKFDSPIKNISIKSESNSKVSSISVDTQNHSILLAPVKNHLARYWVFVILIVSIFYFMLIFLLHRLFSRVTRVLGAYHYSYDDVQLGIIITDHVGRIKSYNKSIMHILPTDTSLQKNKNIFSVFQGTNDFVNAIEEAFREEIEINTELAFTKDKFRFIGKVQVRPLFTMFGIPHSFVIKIKNLTLDIEKDRSVIWSRIAQKVAHDIKTPLSTIQLNIAALRSRIVDGDFQNKNEINDDIDMIHNEIVQITQLTRSFLKFSNLERPNLQWVNPVELIENSIQNFAHYFNGKIKFESKVDESLKAIWVDPNQMVQLFHVFIENSIDAIKDNGLIQINMELVEDLQHEGKAFVEIFISDNGKGISQDEISKVFEPYFTHKNHGTGMGLTIAKKIVEDHAGTIEIKSKVNFGTTVIIRIPHNQDNNV